ncbi:hypothetical protein Hanom_Chr05g00457701 [Helianthus anomalus]
MNDHVDLGVKEEGSNSKKPEGSQDRGMFCCIRKFTLNCLYLYWTTLVIMFILYCNGYGASKRIANPLRISLMLTKNYAILC